MTDNKTLRLIPAEIIEEQIQRCRQHDDIDCALILSSFLFHNTLTITTEQIAEALYQAQVKDAPLNMFVKSWEESKQGLKDCFLEQAAAVIKLLEGE